MKSLLVHYKNKYPKGQVYASENELDVYNAAGEHVVAIRKNGAGQVVDVSKELGLRDEHDLAPIPKDARCFKVKGGCVAKDEEHDAREKAREEFMDGDKVLSCEDLKAKGYAFCDKQRVIARPAKA